MRRTIPKTATVAVKPCRKFSPPTGPISPAAKKPAVGAPPSASATARGVVVGQAEHPAPAAVAGEHQRAGRASVAERLRRSAERVVQVAVGRVGVARVHAHDLARLDRRADRDRAGVGVAAEHARTRKSPWTYSGLSASTTMPEQQPARAPSISLLGRRGRSSTSRSFRARAAGRAR